MIDPEPFAVTAQRWHDFYLLTGGAAATLTGLMFVAVTFGTSLVTEQNAESMRAFVDPPLSHFVHVILTACLFVMPTMTAPVFGGLLFAGVGVRCLGLVWVYRHYRRAHEAHGDMEASDWLIGIILPGLAFALLIAAAVGFLMGYAIAFTVVAATNVGILIIGVRSAWELMLWLVTEVARRNKGGGPAS